MNFFEQKKRYISIFAAIGVIVVVFLCRLVYLQIIKGDDYADQSAKKVYRTTAIKAPRGQILDRYGRELVINRQGFTVVFDKSLIDSDELNNVILETVNIFDNTTDEYIDYLAISKDYPYDFITSEEYEKDYKELRDFLKDKKTATGETADSESVLRYLQKRYKIKSEDMNEIRKIAGVRYEMERNDFSKANPYIFATDISKTMVTYIRENSINIKGVQIEVEPVREIVDGSIAPHILGRIGRIYKEEYPALKLKGYKMNDQVGKDGLEAAMEDYLRGTDGVKGYERDSSGKIVGVVNVKDPIPGNNVITTLDKDLQIIAQKTLEETIKNIAEKGKTKKDKAGIDADAGAVVAMNVKSGEILAMASYPTFDLSSFSTMYSQLLKEDGSPLLNRAIAGIYEPGSTFKMCTALSCLQNGIITPFTTITDKGVYTYYEGYHPRCWVYTSQGRTHGTINVSGALRDSCNYFFYESGRKLGIDKLVETATMFGLGEKTGIEIGGEAKGILASPAQKQKKGQVWNPGDTLQAAIGQSENLFTPIQLCSYISTLANGGTRYKPTLIKDIVTYNDGESVVDCSPKVLSQLNISNEHMTAIKKGMLAVTKQGGTVYAPFVTCQYDVAGKSGTAQVPKGTSNGLFACFAPYEDPEIAVFVVIEHGSSGASVAPVARQLIDAYLAKSDVSAPVDKGGDILN
ncbi:MAG: penicillin-binding protein 2 [Clostridia bacterium]|nr:penicillin-binding protein 2 [Clostridia bacterium]